MGGYTWTRDGSALVFASDHAGPMALHVVDIESGEIQALGVSPAEYPDTARENDLLVYQIPLTQSTLAEVTLDGGAAMPPRPLAPSTGNDDSPRLSPAGDRVVFVSDRSGQRQLWLHDLAAGTTLPLTDDSARAVTSPRWSADGNQVVAIQHDADGRKLIEIDIASHRRRVLSKPDENVLLGAYGFDTGSYLFVSGTSGRDNQLVLVRHPGEAQETRAVLARAVATVEPDPATRTVYYTPTAERGLFRVDPADGVEHRVTSKLTSVTNGWRVVDGRIWYIGDIEVRTANLHELDPASGADRVIGRIDAIMRDLQFSVTPDRKRLIAVPLTAEDTDVGMLRLTREGARAQDD
jgi:Tol biopolymer transport system component